MNNNTVPPESCWYCPDGEDVADHPMGEAWALCGTCQTIPGAVEATEAMNRTREFYIGQKVRAFKWRDWRWNNLGDWNKSVKEAMPK